MNTYKVNRQHWAKLSIFEQMGNIYSEVGRAIKAKDEGQNNERNDALIRALDLFDATTLAQLKKSPARAKEVLRAKEEFVGLFYSNLSNQKNILGLENYFYNFALAARLDK